MTKAKYSTTAAKIIKTIIEREDVKDVDMFKNQIDLLILSECKSEKFQKAWLDIIQSNKEKYYRSIKEGKYLLERKNIDHSFFKCVRTYPYYDSNVDIILHADEYGQVIEYLERQGWSRPSQSQRMYQYFVEAGKIKMYRPGDESFMPLHLYRTGSWRGFEYFPADEVIERSKSKDLSLDGELRINVPPDSVDFVIHCAHIVFESYRLRLGEVIHLLNLLETTKPDETLPKRYGWTQTYRMIRETVERIGAQFEANGKLPKFPMWLPLKDLLPCWNERARYHFKERKPLQSGDEWLRHMFWRSVLKTYHSWNK